MCFGHLHFSEHEKLQCPQLAKAITKKPDDLHPAHGSLLYMTIFYIIYTSLSIIYRQHRYFTLKKIRPRVIFLFLTVSKNKIAATPENIGVVAILTVVLNYSILFPSFTFFLDGFHLAFGDKFEICIKTTDLM